MAHLEEIKLKNGQIAHKLHYYENGQRKTKYFKADIPKSKVLAIKKNIEANSALDKAGIPREKKEDIEIINITLGEMASKVINARKYDVSVETLKRNQYAIELFTQVVGYQMQVKNIGQSHIEQFKSFRYNHAVARYKEWKWKLDDDKIKRGINKELENVKTVFRTAYKKGFILESMIPRFEAIFS